MFQFYDHLGFNNPYYFNNTGTFVIKQKFADILANFNQSTIDPIAVIEFLNRNCVLADRTLVKDIQRTPWLAKPNASNDKWEYSILPKHDTKDIDEKNIAKSLFQKICTEIKIYIGTNKKIGILLSGGMDSRIVAGALDYLIKTKSISDIEVTGLTWGDEGTRDVVYAKEISKRLNWKWKHYKVTTSDLLNNIKETAIYGCDYSPIHLHAIPQIRDDNDLDVVLAGSYGDSIGRAEYAGKKLRFLNPILGNVSNIGGILHQSVFNSAIKQIKSDIKGYHDQFPQKELYMQNELDYQLHYMRRQLNPCMELLTEKMKFYQVFTQPDLYRFMWSIKPERRNDMVYSYMIQEFKTKLDDIPWARTGLPYRQATGVPDSYKKNHHSYYKNLTKDFYEEIASLILSDEIKQLKIFNHTSLKTLVKLIKYFPPNNPYYIDRILWLGSLSVMVKIYKIKGLNNVKSDNLYTSTKKIIYLLLEYLVRQYKNMHLNIKPV